MRKKIERPTYLQQLIDSRDNGLIKIVTGIRRVGKSYLLKTLFREYLLEQDVAPDHILLIDLEDKKQATFKDPDYLLDWVNEKMTDDEQYYIIIDEVQKVNDFVDMLGSLGLIDNADVYVTGSNSHFLSSDIATEFRGRGDEIHIYPLSFKEFMSVYEGDIVDGWQEYYTFGGLPKVLSIKGVDKKSTYLRNLYRTVYLKDIYDRHDIENKAEFEELVRILASSIGGLVNPLNLANTFKSVKKLNDITDKTISTYIGYLEDAYLIEKSQRYDIKGKKYIYTPSKYYFTDIGLRNARLNFRQVEETHIMENIIFNELRVRGYNVDIGIVVANQRDANGANIRKQLEIDFVCNKGSKRYYIQSAYAMPTAEKLEQEQRSLLKTGDAFKKIIITKDSAAPLYNESGVLVMSIYDFLLDPNSMDI